MIELNSCRLCKHQDINRQVVRYGVRHYCHAECGFERWGDGFLRKVYGYEIGNIPYRLLQTPNRKKLAVESCTTEVRLALSAMECEG